MRGGIRVFPFFFFDDQLLMWSHERRTWTLCEIQHGSRSVVHYSTVDLA